MFEETVNKIGAIIALILGIAAIIILVGCIVVGLIFVIKESKEKRKSKDTASKAFIKKGEYFKLKGINCQETDEKKRQLYEVMQNFKEFCKKYKLEFNIENFQWYTETQLIDYKYKEKEN